VGKLGHDDVIAVDGSGDKSAVTFDLLQPNDSEAVVKQYVGLDVSQKETSVCVVGESGRVSSAHASLFLRVPDPVHRKRSEMGALRRQGLSWIGMVLMGVSALCLDLGRALLTL
jgi:hypothetical protein